jgi:4-amino-4-deoxy-L-arabinose transferase-like glycosyltransferase
MGFRLIVRLRQEFGSWINLVLLGLIIVIIGLHAISLGFLHSPFMDEPILVSRAWSWLKTGLNFGALDAGVIDKKFDGFWTFHPLIPTWLHALFIYMFGLDLAGVRLASIVCGIGLSLAVFWLSYQLTSSYLGALVAVLLLVSSNSFALSARIVRYDIIVAMFGFAALSMLWAASRRGSLLLSFVSGLSLGLAVETHMNGAVYGPVVAYLIFAQWGMRFYKVRSFWGLTAGGCTSLLSYLWIHVIRYPETYFGMGRAFAGTHYPPLIGGNLSTVVAAFREMGTFVLMMTQLGVIVIVIAVIMLWRNREHTTALNMALVGLISFTLLIKAKNFYYFIIISPFLYILVAAWLEIHVHRFRSLRAFCKFSTALGFAAIVINTALGLIAAFGAFSSRPTDDAKLIARHIERHLSTEGSLIGMQLYWFDLHQYRYLSWQQILTYRLYEPKSTFYDAMTALRPDVFVIDDYLREYIFTDNNSSSLSGSDRYRWERRLMKADIDAFLTRQATLSERIQTKNLGLVEIYTINWRGKSSRAAAHP